MSTCFLTGLIILWCIQIGLARFLIIDWWAGSGIRKPWERQKNLIPNWPKFIRFVHGRIWDWISTGKELPHILKSCCWPTCGFQEHGCISRAASWTDGIDVAIAYLWAIFNCHGHLFRCLVCPFIFTVDQSPLCPGVNKHTVGSKFEVWARIFHHDVFFSKSFVF